MVFARPLSVDLFALLARPALLALKCPALTDKRAYTNGYTPLPPRHTPTRLTPFFARSLAIDRVRLFAFDRLT